MKMSDAFPSNWVQASDLGGNNVVVTIAKVTM